MQRQAGHENRKTHTTSIYNKELMEFNRNNVKTCNFVIPFYGSESRRFSDREVLKYKESESIPYFRISECLNICKEF